MSREITGANGDQVEILEPVPVDSVILAELRRINGRLGIVEQQLQRQNAWLEHIARGYSRRPITVKPDAS